MRSAFRFLRIRSGAIGLAIVLLVIAVAFLGRYVAPHDPNAPVGAPLAGPSSSAHLGTDFLGRDVFGVGNFPSRVGQGMDCVGVGNAAQVQEFLQLA